MTGPLAPERRFTDRVEHYAKTRPGYPAEILEYLHRDLGLRPGLTAAEIGAGTGIFSKLLLEDGFEVLAVEPNDAMRTAAERELSGAPRYASVAGSAESTGLTDASVDVIFAAQAFHWFDVPRTKAEFMRILRGPRCAVILWNDRRLAGRPFLDAYEAMLRTHGIDYESISRRTAEHQSALAEFFDPGSYRYDVFANSQRLDFPDLVGRVLSCSYAPGPAHPGHAALLQELKRMFNLYNSGGAVTMEYETKVYSGTLGA